MKPPITAWSFYRLLDYETCPHRLYLKAVQRAPQPEFDDKHPIVRGRKIHEMLEKYIVGEADVLPKLSEKHQELVDWLHAEYKKGNVIVEEQWGATDAWMPTDYFGEDVWLRVLLDAAWIVNDQAIVVDWKTGKKMGNEVKYTQQGQLYAAAVFMRYPEVQIIDTKFEFVDENRTMEKTYRRGDKIFRIIKKFTERANRLTQAVDFRPKPNIRNCKYCPFGTANGTGACAYAVEDTK